MVATGTYQRSGACRIRLNGDVSAATVAAAAAALSNYCNLQSMLTAAYISFLARLDPQPIEEKALDSKP